MDQIFKLFQAPSSLQNIIAASELLMTAKDNDLPISLFIIPINTNFLDKNCSYA